MYLRVVGGEGHAMPESRDARLLDKDEVREVQSTHEALGIITVSLPEETRSLHRRPAMYYFTFQTKDGTAYAAVEDAEQARKYEQAGWTRVSVGEFVGAWRAKDGWPTLINPIERTVGDG
jgi:hypothetical protein